MNRIKRSRLIKIFHATVNAKTYGCVSFMLPVFNKAKYLNRSIGSIIRQNYKCLEIITINDASTDNSLDILNYWMKHDKRVIVHTTKKNQGIMLTRIQGVLLSIYEYTHPMDPDDELPENSLKTFVDYAIQTNSDMVMGKVLVKTRKGIGTWNYKMIREYMNRTQMLSRFTACSMNWNLFRLIKRKVFLPAVQLLMDKYYVPLVYADDKLLMAAVIYYSNNFSYYSKPTYIYYYGLPDNSVSGAYFKKKFSNPQSSSLASAFIRIIFPGFKC